jgi:putative nucleotidyltransferase with HDIG domain
MNVPSRLRAEYFLKEAASHNPGPWVSHARNVAQAAEIIARATQALDVEAAYVMGLLHDIGRQEDSSGMRHILEGYRFLHQQGYEDAARICLTHSFPIKDPHAGADDWDGQEQEFQFIQDYLQSIDYNHYDYLIQLCDAVCLPEGFCLLEKRMVDVVLRHGFNEYTLPRWNAFFAVQRKIEKLIDESVYRLLPGVIETTFGWQ